MINEVKRHQFATVSIITTLFIWNPASVVASDYSKQQKHRSHQNQTYLNKNERGAMGNVRLSRQSPRAHSHRRAEAYVRPQHYSGSYNTRSGQRPYATPAQRYHQNYYTPVYPDSRFPQSYRNYNYYQQFQPQAYNHYRISDNGWHALLNGRTNSALRQFSIEAKSRPKDGLSMLGYALSAASSGNLNQGVVSMRRAFIVDPEALRDYRAEHQLQAVFNDVRTRYQHRLKRRSRRHDEAFMVASLSYFNADYTTASEALRRAERDGDRSRSFKNLRFFLNAVDYRHNR